MARDLNWKKVKEEPYRAGWRKMLKKTFILLNGQEFTYDTKDEGRMICGVALTDENKVILTKVFRPGPEKVLMELPGGHIEEGEDPLVAAKREILEETGYSGDFEIIGELVDDAYSNCVRYCFVARNCKKVQEPTWEVDEDCDIIEMDLKDFREHLRSGQLTDVEIGYFALDYLKLL
ncbi:MAG: NUDIX hydrolase [Microgenomates group bacterium]